MSDKSNIIYFRNRDQNTEQQESSALVGKERIEKERRSYGAYALNRLSPKGGKLSPGDRVIIAKNIEKEIEESGIDSAKLAAKAKLGGGTKELHRLRLPADADPTKRGLRAYPINYRKVIEALSKLSGTSLSIMVDRITFGTSIHPARAEKLKEAEMLQELFQKQVNKIDCEFGLLQLFRDTLDTKLASIQSGLLEDWPLIGEAEDLDISEPVLADLNLSLKALKVWGFKKEDKKRVLLRDMDTSDLHPNDRKFIKNKLDEFESFNTHQV